MAMQLSRYRGESPRQAIKQFLFTSSHLFSQPARCLEQALTKPCSTSVVTTRALKADKMWKLRCTTPSTSKER